MSLVPGEDIGLETHEDTDQFFRVEVGNGVVSIDATETPIVSASGIVVPAGARHNVTNTRTQTMRLYTIYAPPHHEDDVGLRGVSLTKEETRTKKPRATNPGLFSCTR